MQVAMRQFKSSVSSYLALAQQGECIDVTSHKRPIARIVGFPSAMSDQGMSLLSHPCVAWLGGKPAEPSPVLLSAGGPSLSEMVLQDRS
jgi:antitoxin (DNA-binding transcriptional repressor) of toxin-antitoxin stability system